MMGLTKIQDSQQKKKLMDLKNTYPKLKLITYEEYGRLWNPDIFPYSNKARLYKDVTNKVLQNFDDFHYAFQKLPNSYKDDILLSWHFQDCLNKIFYYSGYAERKKKHDRPIQSRSYALYLEFFTIGIDGLVKSMPEEFQSYLYGELEPVINLMQSISKFSKNIDPKLNIPFPQMPDRMRKSEIGSLN